MSCWISARRQIGGRERARGLAQHGVAGLDDLQQHGGIVARSPAAPTVTSATHAAKRRMTRDDSRPRAIETRALRKVYPVPKPRRGRGAGRAAVTAAPSGRSAARPPGGAAMAPAGDTDGGAIVALDGLDLSIDEGEFFGLLGPNGAGKTTTIGILTTRVMPSGGQAFIGGADVVADAVAVRRRIGVVPQRPNPDRGLDVLENLTFHAAYFGFPRAASRARALEHPRAPRPRRPRAGARRRALGRPAAAPHDRARAHARAARDLPRRADRGPRPAGAPRAVGDPARAARRGPHDRHDDALHGGGRAAVRARRHRRPRQAAGLRRARRRCKKQAPGGTLVELTLDGDAAPRASRRAPSRACSTSSPRAPSLRVYHPAAARRSRASSASCRRAGRQVTNIHLVPPNLETLFLSLTGRKLD